ncbi:gp436 family protein [Cypionkella sinensis]|uniref:Gp436 family protein n=1 Tax=Cypionkella sinensis TaxID=1756043 RepID=A0ABV7IWJ8_9RHOB
MTYATQQQMATRFGEAQLVLLTDRASVATGVIDAAVMARALSDADAVIDGYLGARYTLPLAEIPPLITDLAQVIAYWKLHISEPDAKTRTDYEQAVKMLKDIANGTIRIPAAGIEPATSGASGVMTTDRDRPFTRLSRETIAWQPTKRPAATQTSR